jgi:hypothetical protein
MWAVGKPYMGPPVSGSSSSYAKNSISIAVRRVVNARHPRPLFGKSLAVVPQPERVDPCWLASGIELEGVGTGIEAEPADALQDHECWLAGRWTTMSWIIIALEILQPPVDYQILAATAAPEDSGWRS